jgi:hypothetical protein
MTVGDRGKSSEWARALTPSPMRLPGMRHPIPMSEMLDTLAAFEAIAQALNSDQRICEI